MMVDYHIFDFNDDGLEDYILCIDGYYAIVLPSTNHILRYDIDIGRK